MNKSKRSPEANQVWQEFQDFCKKHELESEQQEFIHYGEGYEVRKPDGKFKDFPHELEVIEQGGCHNDGGTITIVVRVGDFLFMDEGYYSSWDCNQWEDSWNEVKAVEVTKIEYHVI